jgi:hypothetical protein
MRTRCDWPNGLGTACVGKREADRNYGAGNNSNRSRSVRQERNGLSRVAGLASIDLSIRRVGAAGDRRADPAYPKEGDGADGSAEFS